MVDGLMHVSQSLYSFKALGFISCRARVPMQCMSVWVVICARVQERCRAGHLSVVVWLDLVGRERVPYCEAKVELGIDS